MTSHLCDDITALTCRSAELEQLYQQFSWAQRRTSLLVSNLLDLLARTLVSLLTWPPGWGGVACAALAALPLLVWAGLSVLALTRRDVMLSPHWLRYLSV